MFRMLVLLVVFIAFTFYVRDSFYLSPEKFSSIWVKTGLFCKRCEVDFSSNGHSFVARFKFDS